MKTLKEVLLLYVQTITCLHLLSCTFDLKVSAFSVNTALSHLALTLSPVHTIYLCITMNRESHRGSYTSLTFITIILFPVSPLFYSILQCPSGVYTFFSFCRYLSLHSGHG